MTTHSLSIFSTFQVPLLTVRGQTFASRVAATLVENAGVSVELVVHTKQDCTSMFSFSTRVCFLFFDNMIPFFCLAIIYFDIATDCFAGEHRLIGSCRDRRALVPATTPLASVAPDRQPRVVVAPHV